MYQPSNIRSSAEHHRGNIVPASRHLPNSEAAAVRPHRIVRATAQQCWVTRAAASGNRVAAAEHLRGSVCAPAQQRQGICTGAPGHLRWSGVATATASGRVRCYVRASARQWQDNYATGSGFGSPAPLSVQLQSSVVAPV
jgi:hypothetical protein